MSLPAPRTSARHTSATTSAQRLPVVAHIMPWSGIGGVEIATLRLIATTRKRFQHVAYLLQDALDLRRCMSELGIPIRTYHPPTPSLRHGLLYLRESREIARLLREDRVELVHFADMKAAEHTSLGAWIAGCRRICHVRVSMPQISLRNKLTYLPVQRFLFVSQEAQRTFGFRFAQNRSQVLYDAVEVSDSSTGESVSAIRQELGLSAKQPVVGMVARVSAQKDYRTLARAAVDVLAIRPEVVFLVVGDNALVELNRRHFAEVSEELERLGVREAFHFTGHRDDVSRLIRAMDFCVLSTHREGFPLTLLEIMAEGKPVVATSVGGIPEIVKPGENGDLVPHQDSTGLAKAILHLLDHPEEVRRMGEAARAMVLREYSPGRYADEMTAVYRGILHLPLVQQSPSLEGDTEMEPRPTETAAELVR